MSATLNPYLTFRGQTRGAMEFYRSIFGGELTIATFEEFHAVQDPAESDLVMHAELAGAHGITLHASDVPESMDLVEGSNVSLSLTGDDEELLRGYFERLAEGGATTMPMQEAGWGDLFGMCTDRFGIRWLVDIVRPQAAGPDEPAP